MHGKRPYKTISLRYLGIKIDENLNCKTHIHDLASKLNGANAILAKLRYFANSEVLRSTYFCYIPFSFELCMHCLGTCKIFSTKSVYSPKKSTKK